MQLEDLQKTIGKEIKKLRCMNDWTQEQIAEKLNISRNAYGDIERGGCDINLSRLTQIGELFGVEPNYFFDADERNIFNLTGTQNAQSNKNQCNHWHVHAAEENNLQHELEKAQLVLDQKDKENALLQREIAHLQKIINLMEAGNIGA